MMELNQPLLAVTGVVCDDFERHLEDKRHENYAYTDSHIRTAIMSTSVGVETAVLTLARYTSYHIL